jgi:hypothetical protein
MRNMKGPTLKLVFVFGGYVPYSVGLEEME